MLLSSTFVTFIRYHDNGIFLHRCSPDSLISTVIFSTTITGPFSIQCFKWSDNDGCVGGGMMAWPQAELGRSRCAYREGGTP